MTITLLFTENVLRSVVIIWLNPHVIKCHNLANPHPKMTSSFMNNSLFLKPLLVPFWPAQIDTAGTLSANQSSCGPHAAQCEVSLVALIRLTLCNKLLKHARTYNQLFSNTWKAQERFLEKPGFEPVTFGIAKQHANHSTIVPTHCTW